MSLTLENLRLVTALAHAAPRARIQLMCAGDRRLTVGSHPAADIDICAFRRVVMASACPARPDCSEWIHDVAVGGSLSSTGGGVFVSDDGTHERCWFATLLRPERVAHLLEVLDVDDLPDGAVTARLKPDPGLGVTVVSTAVETSWSAHVAAEVATTALQACLVEELVIDVHNGRGRRPHGHRAAHDGASTDAALRSDRTDRRPPA